MAWEVHSKSKLQSEPPIGGDAISVIGIRSMEVWLMAPEMRNCDWCEELKPIDYEGGCGMFFTCKECRDEEGIGVEDMGGSF